MNSELNHFKARIINWPGVQAIGDSEQDGRPCLKVYLKDRESSDALELPGEVAGLPVVRVISGEIQAQ